MLKRGSSVVQPYTAAARNYSLRDYPAIKTHFKYNETSGTDITDEVSGLIIRRDGSSTYAGSIAFGNPTNSITILTTNAADGEPEIGTYSTFTAGKFVYLITVMRSKSGVGSGGGGSLGSFGNLYPTGPGIAVSFNNGMHCNFCDGAVAASVATDVTKLLIASTDYVIVGIVRPTGQLCEGRAYDLSGNLVQQQTVVNPGLGNITPVSAGSPDQAFYQKIAYQFSTEPADLLSAIIWHGACATQGIKGPYPGWKYHT